MNIELIKQTNYKGLENVINLYYNISIYFIGICDIFKKWFKIGKKQTQIDNPIEKPLPTPIVPKTPKYREILLSNPPGESTAKSCCTVENGLTKYIDYTFEISAGLVIYNDVDLTERTFTNNSFGNKYLMVYDSIGTNGVNGGKRFAIKFDSEGTVSNLIDCTTKTPKTTSTETQKAYEYDAIRCGDEVKIKIISNNPNLSQNIYSSSEGFGGTCYSIISGPTEIIGIGNTYYLIGDCNDKKCAQL